MTPAALRTPRQRRYASVGRAHHGRIAHGALRDQRGDAKGVGSFNVRCASRACAAHSYKAFRSDGLRRGFSTIMARMRLSLPSRIHLARLLCLFWRRHRAYSPVIASRHNTHRAISASRFYISQGSRVAVNIALMGGRLHHQTVLSLISRKQRLLRRTHARLSLHNRRTQKKMSRAS